MDPHRTRARLSCALAAVIVWAMPHGALAAGGPTTVVSSDPYTNSAAQHRTEVDPASAVHGSTVVSTFMAGLFGNGDATNVGWSTSFDYGKSWQHGFLPGTTKHASPAGSYARASDPSIAYDAFSATWVIVSMGVRTIGQPPVPSSADLLVSRSTNGITWSTPTVIPASFADKPAVACDNGSSSPFYGNCYTSFTEAGNGVDQIKISKSADGGMTWDTPMQPADKAEGFGGEPTILSTGRIVVPYLLLSTTPYTLADSVSSDGGASWSARLVIATVQQHLVAAGIFSPPLPSPAVDKHDKVYVVWSDCRFTTGCVANDVVMETSSDGGLSWSGPRRLPATPRGGVQDVFEPAIAIDTSQTTPRLALAYAVLPQANCTGTACTIDVTMIDSMNGAVSWSRPRVIFGPMLPSWLAAGAAGPTLGSYLGTVLQPGATSAVVVFPGATSPSSGRLNESILGGVVPLK